jgi:hypothetical protein
MKPPIQSRIKNDFAFWPLRTTSWIVSDDAKDLQINRSRKMILGKNREPNVILSLARLAGEWIFLVRAGVPIMLAGWAAARAAAQFAKAEHFTFGHNLRWID